MSSLLVPYFRKFGVGNADLKFAAYGECVSDQQQFHRTIDKQT